MKISLVITVWNEEKTIKRLLKSLEKQTRKPDEIIFVDGGSKDRTVQLIEAKVKRNKRIKILVKKGSTIAQGRNLGIKAAKNEIIGTADAGCAIHADWLENIIKPFKDPSVGIVAGFYRMTGKNTFQQALAPFLGTPPEKLDPQNFMPSARSLAFRKKVWEKVGGFNEKLERAGEDTLFNYQAKNLGVKSVTAPKALVDWEMPKTLNEAIKKFYFYAKGDAQAGIWWHPAQRFSSHNLKIMAIYARYLLGLTLLLVGFSQPLYWKLLLILIIAYLFWSIYKHHQYLKNKKAIAWILPFQILSDLAVMVGFASGIVLK